MTPEDLIAELGLMPHPEGGHYRRVYEGPLEGGRPRITHIYYLLEHGEASRWHRIDADELWHHYAGAPLELSLCESGKTRSQHRLGTDLSQGERPFALVPAHYWQSARSLGSYTLIGATVSPGFTFRGFELAAPDFSPD